MSGKSGNNPWQIDQTKQLLYLFKKIFSRPFIGVVHSEIEHVCFMLFLADQPADSKREEFRKYLEKAGVMDVLTKGMTSKHFLNIKYDYAISFINLF